MVLYTSLAPKIEAAVLRYEVVPLVPPSVKLSLDGVLLLVLLQGGVELILS